MSIEVNTRKALVTNLQGYCHFCGDDDLIEVTEWINGEGWDINLTSKLGSQHISLTDGELRALLVLINYGTEYENLKPLKEVEREATNQKIIDLKREQPGLSLRKIAGMVGVNPMKVKRVLDSMEPERAQPPDEPDDEYKGVF